MSNGATAKEPKIEASVYRLKVTLKGSKPPIWRRLEVRSDTTLDKLHRVLQIVMGWEDCHLHKFVIGKSYYSSPPAGLDDDEFYLIAERGRDFTLEKVVPVEKTKFLYQYNFGDDWEHQILVEKIFPLEPGKQYPACFSGKRACPPEDVGGIWGYLDFLAAVNDPGHPLHGDWLEWFEDGFDPEAFDLDAVNAALRKYIE